MSGCVRTAAVALSVLVVTSLFGESPALDQVTTVFGDKADCDVSRKSGDSDLETHHLRVGSGGDDFRGFAPLFFFALPKLPSPDSLLAAELELHYMGPTGGIQPAFSADLFGLGTRATTTGSIEDYPGGSSSALMLVRPLLAPNSPLGRTRVRDARFREYVASMYNPDGTPTAAYAVFRVSSDAKFPPANRRYQGYELASADKPNGVVTYTPQLTLTYRQQPTASLPTPSSDTAAQPAPATVGEDLRPVIWILASLLAVTTLTTAGLVVLSLRMWRRLPPHPPTFDTPHNASQL
jgi:hypothetical protein